MDVPADATNAPSMPSTAGAPFAAELRSNVPERYVMSLGREPYIRRAGYAAIAILRSAATIASDGDSRGPRP